MLFGALRTKERIIIIALAALIVLAAGMFTVNHLSAKKKYEEQAVMAEEYLSAGNYIQAIEAYRTALSMKNGNKELLSIGLAGAYVGVNDYEKALEVLRDCYQKTNGVALKEKIEEVTLKKKDYDYLQTISHADTYFSNGEYEKAISEYDKAKQIKSKEAVSYKKIAEAYIAMGNYSRAREEVMSGLALTQSEELNSTLKLVDSYLLKTEYDEIMNAASEYIYQENYEDGILKYREAIDLFPGDESAYNQLAQVYISLGDYEEAVKLLEGALKIISSNTLKEAYDNAVNLKLLQEERKRILSELYTAVKAMDPDKILEVMELPFFAENVVSKEPIYYNSQGEGNPLQSYGMIITGEDRVYAGGMESGQKQGIGTFFMRIGNMDESGWYCYEGEWDKDAPNGRGRTTESLPGSRIVTEGKFLYGKENGQMQKCFYRDTEELETVFYSAVNGVPIRYLDENGNPVPSDEEGSYTIGKIYKDGEPSVKYHSVKNGTVWGVRSFYEEK